MMCRGSLRLEALTGDIHTKSSTSSHMCTIGVSDLMRTGPLLEEGLEAYHPVPDVQRALVCWVIHLPVAKQPTPNGAGESKGGV